MNRTLSVRFPLVFSTLGAGLLGAALLLTQGLNAPPVASDAPRAKDAPAARLALGCKPHAPIALELREVPQGGGELTLEYRIQPKLAMDSLRFEFALPSGAVLLEGPLEGPAAPGRGEVTEGRARLWLPADGAYRSVTLSAHGVFQGHDEHGPIGDEPVTSVATLSWGEIPTPTPTLSFLDPESGELTPMAVVPSLYQPARAAPHRPAPQGGR
ncbi:MAG: hypothetical protein ACT4PU_09590 [Planctomycetota bacterium]